MNRSIQSVLLLVVVSLATSGQSVDCASRRPAAPRADRKALDPGEMARRQSEERIAAAALGRLGVPLDRDPSGRVRWIKAVVGELNDEAMRHLGKIPMLEWLEIRGGVTAAGLAHLGDCRALRRLYIHDVSLDGDALQWLADLRLEALSLQRTGIGGGVLEQLKSSATLTVLNLSGNDITDEDMSRVARFRDLEVLALQKTLVTGAGLSELRGLPRLNVLNLSNCQIGDADLRHFASMPNLRIVHIAGCSISDEAVEELGEELPMLALFR